MALDISSTPVFTQRIGGSVVGAQSLERPRRTQNALVNAAKIMVVAVIVMLVARPSRAGATIIADWHLIQALIILLREITVSGLREFLAESPDPFAKPPLNPASLERDRVDGSGDHAAIYANFVDAIENGAQLVADGAQARQSLELANALIYSSVTGQPVELPLDRAAYSALMESLRAENAGSPSPGTLQANLPHR